ncbi:MAG: ribonuclease H-like domain-containing protein [Candidatus Ventricola sp.]
MRNLREKLMAVSSRPAAARSAVPPAAEPFFCRETITPLDALRSIEQTTLEEIRAVDPRFTGEAWDIRRVLFLDTETTGLSGGAGTVAFEIGVGFLTGRSLVIRQYVMRDYGEEAAMLAEIAALLRRFDTLVTFNGKSFDLPLLESRLIMARIRLPVTQMPHLDLLHAARRVYKLRLGRCNLASLEEAVLGVRREDDLPGAQVPQRYFSYIQTREFALLEDVLRHNLEDVRSLVSLTAALCAAFRSPQLLSHPEDVFGVGRTLMRGGHTERARSCFRILGHSTLGAQAQLHLAISYKRDKDWAATVKTCQEMIAGGAGGVWPYLELAKYYEHVARDLPRALGYATGALRYTLNTAPLWGADEQQTEQLRKRIARLKRKMNRKETDT